MLEVRTQAEQRPNAAGKKYGIVTVAYAVSCGALDGSPLSQCTLEHLEGRGMGGSKRDDRPDACGVAHWFGNNAKGVSFL